MPLEMDTGMRDLSRRQAVRGRITLTACLCLADALVWVLAAVQVVVGLR